MFKGKIITGFLLIVSALAASGCGYYRNAHPGFYTSMIFGQVKLKGSAVGVAGKTSSADAMEGGLRGALNLSDSESAGGSQDSNLELVELGSTAFPGVGDADRILVAAVSKRRSFMEFKDSHVFFQTYSAVLAGKDGKYILNWGPDVVEMSVYLFAQGHEQITRHFTSGLGIGSFEFNAELSESPNWENTFSLSIKPVLSSFLRGEARQISDADRALISEWIAAQERGR